MTTPYADSTELARVLKIRTPSTDQAAALDRVLLAAAGEINAEIDLADGNTLADWQTAICAQVNLDRAADLWRHTESAAGMTGLMGDNGETIMPGRYIRYSWERYAQRLVPCKDQFGVA